MNNFSRLFFFFLTRETTENCKECGGASVFVNIGDDIFSAKSAEAHLFVNMGDIVLIARSAEALLFVNIGFANGSRAIGLPLDD